MANLHCLGIEKGDVQPPNTVSRATPQKVCVGGNHSPKKIACFPSPFLDIEAMNEELSWIPFQFQYLDYDEYTEPKPAGFLWLEIKRGLIVEGG
ncbi:hypothetical protein GCM10007116_13470 [Sulfodiicoccus acidiphilus]|uniref:Uncharacterized protein n=1 Tax=Sulfodiicoccus acidiphilus TaxID=1670455 RepID=A0A830GZK3_9CREN|nr:hypothetical protein GCM10007116_13470 [Sulfodiicoccus acidiphilus]